MMLSFLLAATLPLADVEWRNVGPGGGGWLQSMTASRHAPERLWIGCDVGGVYLSEDGGKTFVSRNEGLVNLYVEDIAEHPTNPDILFAAGPGGICKTVDRGLHWREVRSGLPKIDGAGYAAPISKVVFDPADAEHVYAAVGDPRGHTRKRARQGLVYESRDGGENWAPRRVGERADVFDLSFDPRNGQMLVSTDEGLYLDGVPSNTGLPAHLRTRRLARAASNPDVVYVTLRHKSGEKPWQAGVYRSSDGGRTWENRSGGLDHYTLGKVGGSDDFTHWYDRLAVHPKNPDEVYVGGATWECEGVWKSTDGGRRWTATIKKKDVTAPWLNMWGPDVRSLALSPFPPYALTFGSAGYAYRSTDRGATWEPIYTVDNGNGTFSSRGLETTVLHSIAHDPLVKGRIYFAYFDIGLWRSDDNGRSMRRIMKGQHIGDAVAVAFDPKLKDHLFVAFGVWNHAERGWVAESFDGGETWRKLDQGGWRPDTISDLVYLNGELYGVVREKALRRFRDGLWADLPVPGKPRHLVQDGGRLYLACGADKKLFRSEDCGRTWQLLFEVERGSLEGLCVAGRRILIGSRDVYYSDDDGESFRKAFRHHLAEACLIAGDALLVSLRDRPYHEHCRGEGVILSTDGGRSWKTLNSSSLWNHNVMCWDADPFEPLSVWGGTHGNSVFTTVLKKEDR